MHFNFIRNTSLCLFFLLFSILNGQSIRLEDLDPEIRQQIINSGVSLDRAKNLIENKKLI